jgi:ABC-type transport system involved in multi-copper enzyme maturation permease subunit
MDKIWAVSYYTFRESLARKTFITFFIISSITLALFLFALNVDIVDGALRGISVFGNDTGRVSFDITEFVTTIESVIATALFTGGLFLSIFATASLVPNMLQKGHVDWLLSKPISRGHLLLGRFFGALAIVSFNVFYLIIGTWLIVSTKTGLWHFPFLISGVLIIGIFAVLYAFMVMLGVLIQNSAVCIMGAYLIVFFSPWLYQRDRIYALLSERVYQVMLDAFYYITPRTFEFGEIVTRSVLGKPIDSWSPVWHSLLIGVFFFLLAIYFFQRKNF